MKIDKQPETLITQTLNSSKIRKLAIGLVLAGIVFCSTLALVPIQKRLALFISPPSLSLPFAGLVILVFAFEFECLIDCSHTGHNYVRAEECSSYTHVIK